MEVRPTKLKSNWNGPRLGSGGTVKEGVDESKAQDHGVYQVTNGFPDFYFGDQSGGPNPALSPNFTREDPNQNALNEPQPGEQTFNDGVERSIDSAKEGRIVEDESMLDLDEEEQQARFDVSTSRTHLCQSK